MPVKCLLGVSAIGNNVVEGQLSHNATGERWAPMLSFAAEVYNAISRTHVHAFVGIEPERGIATITTQVDGRTDLACIPIQMTIEHISVEIQPGVAVSRNKRASSDGFDCWTNFAEQRIHDGF